MLLNKNLCLSYIETKMLPQTALLKADQKSSSIILVLEKAMHLLNRFDSSRAEWGVTELSKDLGINKSTVSKILSTLENHRYLVKSAETRKYKLGLRLFELGSLVASQLDLQKRGSDLHGRAK